MKKNEEKKDGKKNSGFLDRIHIQILNNISLKLLAVVIAFISWLAVMYNINPMDTKTFSVPVNLIHEEVFNNQNWTYEMIGDGKIDVQVKAKSFDMARISADDFNLYVDMRYLSGSGSSEKRGSVSAEVKSNTDLIEEYSLKTNWIDFSVEEIVHRQYKVEVNLNGEVAENYTPDTNPIAVPDTVTVSGKSSEVNQINRVIFNLNVKDASDEVNEIGKPVLVDAEGNEIKNLESVTVSPEEIQVCLPIYQTKQLNIECSGVTGEPASGYGVGSITTDVSSIKVAGYKAVLSNLFHIVIPDTMLNVDGCTENKTFSIDIASLNLPEGVMVSETSSVINVTVKIEKKKQKNFRLVLPDGIDIVGKNEDYEYQFADNSITLGLEGISTDLSSVDIANIVAKLDVTDKEPGNYNIPLSVELPDGITLLQPVSVNISIVIPEVPTEPPITTAPHTETVPPATTQPSSTEPPSQPESSEPGESETTLGEEIHETEAESQEIPVNATEGTTEPPAETQVEPVEKTEGSDLADKNESFPEETSGSAQN